MNRKTKTALLSALLAASFAMPASVFASDPVKVFIQNERVHFDVEPAIESGVTLVQFRPIFEELGLTVEWNSKTNTVTGRKDGLSIVLQINNKHAVVNGETKILEAAPANVDGNTVVPLRFIGEATGNRVIWNESARQIVIRSSAEHGSSGSSTVSDPYLNWTWGMSPAEVQATLNQKPYIQYTDDKDGYDYAIYHNQFVEENDSQLAFKFDSTGLTEVTYLIDPNSTYDEIYDMFSEISGTVSAFYGQNEDDFFIWSDELAEAFYKQLFGGDRKGMIEMAFASNNLAIFNQFETATYKAALLFTNNGTLTEPEYKMGLIYSRLK
ncbi:copper amine oxidase N-terminal domain-containing protein [Paenibacillus sp. UNC499MF]|uniref:copper amine oxidase N-terminal domain-containing protein n=1 Tax=Paenibacillus sp. UNC499MF TaxID=1502751 RepID=UPI00089FCF11|nr:copper amine oxidase N-terminal domain-containing protein [Paenibacillus sp. UNC499MF]SEG46663.1 Copper amine oxidase N-terminal domain-containing protein [Paenibacillus sp. UNC499MF]